MPFLNLFTGFTEYLEAFISQGGYIFLFFTTALEGLPLIGMAIPGHVTIIISGFLAKIGILNLWWVLLIALAGAIVGDYIGFYFGRKYGLSFIDKVRPYFFIKDQHIAKANKILAQHTGKTLILGRFSPVSRALLPFLLGASKTSSKKFWLYNLIGGICWVVISIVVGYVFGSGYHAAAGYFGKFAFFAILLAITILWGYKFVNVRFHIFKRYELFMLIFNLLSLYVLAKTIQDAWAPLSFMANFDIYVSAYMERVNNLYPFLRTVFYWITHLGGTKVMLSMGIILTLWFVARKKWRRAAIVFLTIGSTGFFVGLMKTFFLRERPENALLQIIDDPSFPSGHAAMAAAFFLILAYVLAPQIKSWIQRELVVVGCVIALIAVGVSRVVLNVHWASDVIAGWALGIFCASASVLVVRYIGALVVNKSDKIVSVMTQDIFKNWQ